MTPERFSVNVSSLYFVCIKIGKSNLSISMILVSIGQSTMTVNPSVAFWRARVRLSGLFADMVVRSCLVKLTCYVEEHRSLGGNIFSGLDHGASAGLIYSLLVLKD